LSGDHCGAGGDRTLNTFSIKTLLLMTLFSTAMNTVIKNHFDKLGFGVYLGPSFENLKPALPLISVPKSFSN
jgi:hypothetical protein